MNKKIALRQSFHLTTSQSPSQPPEQRTQEEIQRITDAVRRRFPVTQEYIREGESLEFFLDEQKSVDTKSSFSSLVTELKAGSDTALLRRTMEHGLLLVVFKKPPYPKQRLKIPVILLLATVISVLADGVIRVVYEGFGGPSIGISEGFRISILYTVSLVGIIGIHELGHKVSTWYHKMNASWPYFIPGIPGYLPTFGALIKSAEPPVNRDSLFDLGLSGPIAGLVATIVVSIIAVVSVSLIPLSSFSVPPQTGAVDYYTNLLVTLLKGPASNGSVLGGNTFTLLYLAYSLGFFITFLNLFPAWQLDGGHIANSLVSPKVHRYLTYLSVLAMFYIQLWFMALLILFMSNLAPSLRPLDDVSPLSFTRKILFVLTWILSALIYIFAIYNNAFFNLQPLFG